MRSRFRKVWCPECCTMQFAGECGHGRVEVPTVRLRLESYTALDSFRDGLRDLHTRFPDALILPKPTKWRRYVHPAEPVEGGSAVNWQGLLDAAGSSDL